MTNKVSLDKSKIKFVLLEGVHQSALDTLHAAGYTNIDIYSSLKCINEINDILRAITVWRISCLMRKISGKQITVNKKTCW